jgi:Zn-dependent M28 family amino/carboxypeptidase
MMGRSASRPEHIEKATAFIENEFKKIGLNNLLGLTTYRQEFKKEMIAPSTTEVTINGTPVDKKNVVLASENTSINFSQGLAIKTIDFDGTVTNKMQHLRSKAFGFVRGDTTSSIIVVAPEFESEFKELNSYFGKRFISGRKSTKLFLLGKYDIQSYSVKATQKMETITMANVVGVLPGKTKPDEFVVFSGHYDHIGIRTAVAGDSIANGADDDASGTTAVIELARYFKKVKNNQRTLVFVAFTAEEIGGFGSRYFSEQLNPDKVVAMFNIEMIGKPSKWGQNFAFITGYERSDFGEILQKNLSGTQFEFKPDPYPTQNLFYRSDNATLARLGVPAHTISTDEIDIDKFYHTVDDEVETLDMKNITATIRAIALSSKSIVNGTDTPKRIDK